MANTDKNKIENEWWTTAEIADHIGVQRTTVAFWRRNAQMPKPDGKIGRTWVWKSDIIIKWARNRKPSNKGRKAIPGNPDPQAEWWRLSDIAAHLGIHTSTASSYNSRGQLPEPDLRIGHTSIWKPTRIIEWDNSRKRQSHRGQAPRDSP